MLGCGAAVCGVLARAAWPSPSGAATMSRVVPPLSTTLVSGSPARPRAGLRPKSPPAASSVGVLRWLRGAAIRRTARRAPAPTGCCPAGAATPGRGGRSEKSGGIDQRRGCARRRIRRDASRSIPALAAAGERARERDARNGDRSTQLTHSTYSPQRSALAAALSRTNRARDEQDEHAHRNRRIGKIEDQKRAPVRRNANRR